MRARLAPTLLASALLLIAACGSQPTSGTTSTPTPSAASTPQPSPTATPTAPPQPCAGQTQPGGTPGTFTETNGQTTFTLTIDGCNWTVTQGSGKNPITGTWRYSPATNQMDFTETAGPCGPVTGIYTWSFSGSTLTMTLISDSCSARTDQFNGRAWQKSP